MIILYTSEKEGRISRSFCVYFTCIRVTTTSEITVAAAAPLAEKILSVEY